MEKKLIISSANKIKKTPQKIIFDIFNFIIISFLTISRILPILNVLAYSFSSSQAIVENRVTIWPVEFTTQAYEYVLKDSRFWRSMVVTLERVALGVPLNVIMIALVAYPLSKSEQRYPARKYYVAFMLCVMLFSGGMMPTYFIVSKTGLIDTLAALILPGAVPIFSCIVLMNFFRGVPEEIEESARLDGANPLQILVQIYLPISLPSIATVTLFALIGHWNAWFDGLIYSNHTTNYPMQSYLRTIVVSTTDAMQNADIDTILALLNVNETNMQSAQIFISIIPLMIVYPFLQRYFTSGLTVGSVKG